MLKNKLLAVTSVLTAVVSVWHGKVVAAEEAPAASDGLAEVVVTAQKRSESQQSVPLSMTTFGSAALQEKSINTFFDYATKVPNLAFASTGDGVGTARTISIRGISGDNVTAIFTAPGRWAAPCVSSLSRLISRISVRPCTGVCPPRRTPNNPTTSVTPRSTFHSCVTG